MTHRDRTHRDRTHRDMTHRDMTHRHVTDAADRLARWRLALEGRAAASGIRLPLGRTTLALCRARG